MPSGSLTSAPTKRALPPAASIAATVSAPRTLLRPTAITLAPSAASRRATARPMPEVAPVTSAVRPVRSSVFIATRSYRRLSRLS